MPDKHIAIDAPGRKKDMEETGWKDDKIPKALDGVVDLWNLMLYDQVSSRRRDHQTMLI